MGVYQFHAGQRIPASIDEIWDFISSPANLGRITPPDMGFRVTSGKLPGIMHAGMIIRYRVSPLLKLRLTWVTEITHVVEKEYFVDEQRVGPYRMWHHQHRIEPIEGGVLMTDLVTYQPPFGFLGSIANSLIIRRKLRLIFEFRRQALISLFGDWKSSISHHD